MTAGPVRHRDLDLCLEGPGPPLSLLFPSGKAAECSTSSTAVHCTTARLHDVYRTSESTYLVLYFQPSLQSSSLPRNTHMLAAFPAIVMHTTGSQYIYTVSGIVDA
jgi:hypothetical protein